MKQMIVNEKRTELDNVVSIVISVVVSILAIAFVIPAIALIIPQQNLADLDTLMGLNGTGLSLADGFASGGLFWKMLGFGVGLSVLGVVVGVLIKATKGFSVGGRR